MGLTGQTAAEPLTAPAVSRGRARPAAVAAYLIAVPRHLAGRARPGPPDAAGRTRTGTGKP